jgi:putative CocE/NonD family hydrolase
MRTRYNVKVPMRDGVLLSADVYLPGTAPAPVLVARTPYNKNDQFAWAKARRYAELGFGFVWMDVRGRGDSGGEFSTYRGEGPDGYDTVEWIAEQSWCDGRVGSWGQSYLGCIQWLTAVERPPHLAAMVVYVTPSDPFVEAPTGVHMPMQVCWQRMVDGRLTQYVQGVDWDEVYRHLPLMTMDERAGFHGARWREDLAHSPADTKYWAPVTYQSRLNTVDVPALHVTGWYDDVQPGTLLNFTAMTAPGKPGADAQRLVVGPWDHGLTRTRERQLGGLDFGPDAVSFDLDEFELRWLRHYLAGDGNGADADGRVRIFVMGANRWRTENEWPLARTRWTRYHLSSGGSANTRRGDGALRRECPPGDEPPDTYRYDPADPVPFLTAPTSAQIGGPDDYSAVEERPDVLVYTTPELEADIEVTGPVRVELYASSSAPDTDFTAKLLDVHPDGTAQRLCDGVVRARFRAGMDSEELMEPGQVYRFEIGLWSTSQLFLAGHRIRLEISSSAFPKYDRNLNSGLPLATDTVPQTADNQVWHTAAWPSALILPEIPHSDSEPLDSPPSDSPPSESTAQSSEA